MLDSYLWESNYFISERAAKLNSPLGRGPLQAKANEMSRKGVQITDLSSYIIDQPYGEVKSPPDYVLEAVKRALETGWPPPQLHGIPTLRQTIAEVEGQERGIDVDPDEEVMVTGGGAMQGIYNVLQAVLDPGDETIVFAPGLAFDEHVKLAGGIPVYVEQKEEDGYKLDIESLRRAITPRTKVLILNTPHNPTGRVTPKEELEEIAETVKHHNILVIADELLWKWLYDGHTHVSFASLDCMRERTVIVSSITKSGMFDWRIGWIIANRSLIAKIEKIMFWQNDFSPPLLQVAAEAHLSKLSEWIRPVVRDQQRKRDLLWDGLVKAGYLCFKPESALTAFPNIPTFERSSVKFADLLLEKGHVFVSPGLTFNGEGRLRVGFHKSDTELKEGIRKMAMVLEEVRRKHTGT